MRVIFLGGCERSGTSLVQKILTSHSRIAGGAELVFTGRIAELYRTMAGQYPDSYAARLESFYDSEELKRAFRGLFDDLFGKLRARKPEALYLSEKTPSNIFAAATLLRIFPDSLFVHLIRDGRDVLASHRDVKRRYEKEGTERFHRPTFRPWRVCERWNRAVEAHFDLAKDRSLEGRILTLRYEELVREPETQLRALFDFLELEMEARALTPEAISAKETGVPIDGIWLTEEIDRQGFNPSRIGRWKRSLPFSHRQLANLLMASNLRRTGYEVTRPELRLARALRWVTQAIRPTRRRA